MNSFDNVILMDRDKTCSNFTFFCSTAFYYIVVTIKWVSAVCMTLRNHTTMNNNKN